MIESIGIPLWLSLKVAGLATILSFLIGVVLAWIFAVFPNKLTRFLSLVIMLPLVLPPTVLGFYLLILLGEGSWIGKVIETIFGSTVLFTWQAAVIAASIASLPLIVRPIQTAFESIDPYVLEAAQLDGANRWQIFFGIMIPLSYKGIVGGVILGFARAMGEFGATLMVAGNIPGKTQTLSIAIYDAVQANRMMEANMMVVVLSLTTIGILLVTTKFLKQ
ncbi:molybdate transport system permease protein [Alteribacillus persepolensis]|uniref:Molybdenum transport system permease n=1 Tax=Alteribacillus persepolensis TaxID=568899 RepID=A0A1G8IX89_9BACI|nr:molybdate ABC transporter permease subunit [Alteribacillus persepolensis]SDI23551.1 molybdate transport system permease protein [Alteribacillus persepolensis]